MCVFVSVFVCMYMCMSACMLVFVFVDVYVYVCVCVCARADAFGVCVHVTKVYSCCDENFFYIHQTCCSIWGSLCKKQGSSQRMGLFIAGICRVWS